MILRLVMTTVAVLGLFATTTLAGSAPKVVKTVPAADATDVNPNLDQIVVTFDTPLKSNSHSLVVLGDLEFPDLAGDDPISFPDPKTCIIKVKLKPNTAYGVSLNSKTRTGFKSADDGTPAVPFELRFKTTTPELAGALRVPAEPKGPHVVKTDPPNDATDLEAGTFDLTIVFSEPMKKGQASIITPPDDPRLKVIGQPRWEDARTFIATIMLEPAKNYRLGINVIEPKRFVSAGDGTPAEPYELRFSTKGAPPVGAGKSTTQPADPVRLRYDYRKGDVGRMIRKAVLDIKLHLPNGRTVPIGNKVGLNCIDEVLEVEKGRPAAVRKLISEFVMSQTDPESGQTRSVPRLEEPVAVKVDMRSEPAKVTPDEGRPPKELLDMLAEDSFVDLLPAGPIKVGEQYALPASTIEDIKKALDKSGNGDCSIKLTAKRIGPQEVEDARNEMYRAKGGGTPATYIFDVVEFAIEWKQEGIMEGGAAFTLEAGGKVVFAIEAGIVLTSDVDAKITLKPIQTQDENGQPITITGGGTYTIRNDFQPINWTRGAKRKGEKPKPDAAADQPAKPETKPAQPEPPKAEPKAETKADPSKLPAGWTVMDDKLHGTQVAVPPGWTPRIRGGVALCVEPDDAEKTGVFFVPAMLKERVPPDQLADGLDEMLRRGLPDYQSRAAGKPTSDSVQREFTATLGQAKGAGSYRAVVSKSGMGFLMGYIGPAERIDALRPTFHQILASYRFTGSKMRLQPFKSPAVELKIPPGWQVKTSEGDGSADQDIDWMVTCPQIPGARVFMFTPKYCTSNWVTDGFNAAVDQTQLALWKNRGYEIANLASDQQAMQAGLNAVVPGLEVKRQQSLDELRDLFVKLYAAAIQVSRQTGGRFDIYVLELHGRRKVDGVEMRCVVYIGASGIATPTSLKGMMTLWSVQVRGFEAPADRFAQVATIMETVCGSFCYTQWWMREVQKVNEEQARNSREFWAYMNKVDREIWDNRSRTQSAINEMMYDSLIAGTPGFVNKETGTIEKIPTERIDAFKDESGRVLSPEEIIEKKIDPQWATRVREASADDYMNYDRRVQVWP